MLDRKGDQCKETLKTYSHDADLQPDSAAKGLLGLLILLSFAALVGALFGGFLFGMCATAMLVEAAAA
eukprot:345599-Karenia_brevis.AAC.1